MNPERGFLKRKEYLPFEELSGLRDFPEVGERKKVGETTVLLPLRGRGRLAQERKARRRLRLSFLNFALPLMIV